MNIAVTYSALDIINRVEGLIKPVAGSCRWAGPVLPHWVPRRVGNGSTGPRRNTHPRFFKLKNISNFQKNTLKM
jgi:hypothetical protein